MAYHYCVHKIGSVTIPLRWKSLVPHLTPSFKDLLKNNKFVNVTLVSENQVKFAAHKTILSACSPLLKGVGE